MIQFDQVSFQYPGTTAPALREISFTLANGSLTLLSGASGCGKSTLLRCMNGLTPFFSGGMLRGKIRVMGVDPLEQTPQGMSRWVGFVFQDPEAQFVVDRVEDEIAFGLENVGMERAEMERRVAETLHLLRLEHLRTRRMVTLSGGERQRTAIAAALALRPAVLALDEPTSQLDAQSAEEVLEAVERLKRENSLTVVIAEHRLERVLPFADHLLHLEGGQLVASGPPRQALQNLDLDTPLVRLARQAGTPAPLNLEEAQDLVRKGIWRARPTRRISAPRAAAETILRVEGVDVSLPGKKILENVNFSLQSGELTVLMGANGAGKTTLLRCLVGLLKPERGKVLFAQEGQWRNAAEMGTAAVCRQVAYLPQDPNTLLYADTAEEELWVTLRNHHINAPAVTPLELLSRLGLAQKASQYPRDLSVGERQRVALGAVAIPLPRAALLDEPTRGLDPQAKRELAALLRGWCCEGMAVLVVTHDVEWAALIADRVLGLAEGKIVRHGDAHALLGVQSGADAAVKTPQIPATLTARIFPGQGWIVPEEVEFE